MSSLDDFFAKKDRKKSAAKTTLLAADELYRTLEETAKAPKESDSKEKLQPEVVNNAQTALEFGIRFSDEGPADEEEDEWSNFTDEHDPPFPTLKRNSKLALSPAAMASVANEDVSLSEPEPCHNEDTGGDGLDVGQSNDELDKPACPWLKQQPTAQGPIEPHSAASKLQSNILAKRAEVYVPPALRQSQGDFNGRRGGKQSPPSQVKPAKGQAPDLNNIEFFPSLRVSRSRKRAK